MSVVDRDPSSDFRSPPVREVLLGVQFEPVPWLGPFDIGDLIRALTEAVGGEWRRPGVRMAIGQLGLRPTRDWTMRQVSTPDLRATVLRDDGSRQIQLENGWLTASWIYRPQGEVYPRFAVLRDYLDVLFRQLDQSLGLMRPTGGVEQGGVLAPNFWEFTYVNEIAHDGESLVPMQWHEWIPGMVGRLPHLDGAVASGCSIVTTAQFGAPDCQVESVLEPRLRHSDAGNQQLLSLRITAQGEIGGKVKNWLEGIEVGHKAAFSTFLSLLSDKAREEFGHVDAR